MSIERRILSPKIQPVSVIGLGTVKIGRTRGLKYPGAGPSPAPLPDDGQVVKLLTAAADLGVNLIDTAPAYGVAEERLGAILADNRWFGGRERWVISTKAGEEFDDAAGQSRFDFSPDAVRASVERSLRRLRVEALDVVMLHSDGRDAWVLSASGGLDTLGQLRSEGKVRAIGASTKTVEGGLMAVRAGCDAVMVMLNPAHTAELPVIAAAARSGVGVVIKKALDSGHAPDPAGSIRFAACTPGVSSVVVGTASSRHLQDAVRAVNAA